MRKLLMIGAVAMGAAFAAPAQATEALPHPLAQHLDHAPAEFTWSAAAERRHMIMRETMRQQRYGRGYGYGPRHGYGYGRRYGGPPPWAPAHGYRRHRYDRW